MTIRHMKIFISVYQHSNITKAAEELHLAQPSVSSAIKELENYYGVCLFERIGRRIRPTEAAKEFYSYALHIVSLFEEMETRIRNWDAIGVLRVGSSITIGTCILPSVIQCYHEIYPDLRIEAVVSKSADIEHLLLDNRIDIGIIENQPISEDICAVPFMEDELCAVLPRSHKLADSSGITLEELSSYPFLMREKGSAGRDILDSCFALLQLSIRPVWESASTQAIVRGVAEGVGVAVLPRMLVEKDLREGNVCVVSLKPPLKRKLNMIYHKSKYLTPNMQTFLRVIKDGEFLKIPRPQ